MSISMPPSVFFNGINFNPAFYSTGDEAVTFKFIDANYLRSTNYATSRAAYPQFYGIIYALGGISGNGSQLTNLNASNITTGTLSVNGSGLAALNASNIITGTLSVNGSGLTSLNASNNISGTLSVNGSGLNSLNASNVTLGTLSVSRGGIGTASLINNQVLLGSGTNPISQSSNLLFDTSNNRLGICKTSPNYTLDVSGNINGNNLYLQNFSNANNTLINILSETNTHIYVHNNQHLKY